MSSNRKLETVRMKMIASLMEKPIQVILWIIKELNVHQINKTQLVLEPVRTIKRPSMNLNSILRGAQRKGLSMTLVFKIRERLVMKMTKEGQLAPLAKRLSSVRIAVNGHIQKETCPNV